MSEIRGINKISVRKPEEKRPFGRSERRWEAHTKVDLEELRCEFGLYRRH
jgi:hypothetical protein